MSDFWARMQRRGPDTVAVSAATVRAGSRVRLRPRSDADIIDLALDGRVAVVEGVEQDDEGRFHLAVTLEDDPGRDLGDARLPGHRFFYPVEEVEPLDPPGEAGPAPRVLVAGVGNVFLGDDGFGVAVVRRLSGRALPSGVDVVEFGIRGMDLVYALQRDYQAVIIADAAARGAPPGTLTVLEPEQAWDGLAMVETHGMDPVQVLRLARQLGPVPARIVVVCCEPAVVRHGTPHEDVLVALSDPVGGALDDAVRLIESTLAELVPQTPRRTASRGGGAG